MFVDVPIVDGWIGFLFPPGISFFLFIAFSFLVVRVGQHMVERTGLMLEASERRVAIARTSLCIGSLVWALDVAGLFLYRDISALSSRLGPLVMALVVMVGVARVTVPALITTIAIWKVVASGVGLAAGMIVAHIAVMKSIGDWTGDVRWLAVVMALLFAILVSTGLALRHRWAQIRAARREFWALSWYEELTAAVGILFLHFFLVNAFTIMPHPRPDSPPGFLVLLLLVLFGLVISLDQLLASKIEDGRQESLNRALALVRSVHPVSLENSKHHIALIVERISSLLGDGCMQLHFQPICPVQAQQEGIRLEALLRVTDRDLGAINPETFFLACERAGRTAWADRIVIEHALDIATPWIKKCRGCAGISVNIAPDTLMDPEFVPWLSAECRQRRIPPGWLELEITEHAMVSQAGALTGVLRQLQALGIASAMDDFGSGFSSLTTLADLPIRRIKCDRAFLRQNRDNGSRATLLRHICTMGAAMGLQVTVEGVETEADLEIVRASGAGTAQGYLFAKAMPPDSVISWIEKNGALAAGFCR